MKVLNRGYWEEMIQLTIVQVDPLKTKILTGILCAFDTLKRNAEIKVLLICAIQNVETIINFHDQAMKTLYIQKPED